MDKEILIKNFSRCAHFYDKYADVQKNSALRLLGRIEKENFNNILELGCGTGNYTVLLRDKFRQSKLKALDISGKMLQVAQEKLAGQNVEFIIADAETVNLREGFDLITSNACFQWFKDLGNTLMKYKGLLGEGGTVLFSTFGALTFLELNKALSCIFKNANFAADNFITKNEINKILKRIFKRAEVEEVFLKETFFSLKELLKKIKYTGVRGEGFNNNTPFTMKILNEIEEVYLNKFGQIKATYQIFLCRGIK